MTSEQALTRTNPDEPHGATESRLSQFAGDFAGALLSPSETLRDVGQRVAIIPAMMLVLLISSISVAGQVTALLLNILQAPGFESPLPGPVLAMQLSGVLWNFVWAPVLWTIGAGLLYGATYLLGGRGRFVSLWAATGFALAPQLLVAPISAASELLGAIGGAWQLLGWLVVAPVTLGAFIWTGVLLVIATRETMNVSTGRAIGALAILLGGLILLGILLICVFALLIVAILASLTA